MIGVARRVLDALLMKNGATRLTHEVLTTLMAEVMAIVNARLLVPISYDAEIPEILLPAPILAQKASVTPTPPGDLNWITCVAQWRQVQSRVDLFVNIITYHGS